MAGWTTPTLYLQSYVHEVMRQRGPKDLNAWQHLEDFGAALIGNLEDARFIIANERRRYGL